MSLNISGEKCSVCKAYLFEDDDIVYCPDCGAPHHRECYNGLGHCALEELHGTENQYKKPEQPNSEPKSEKTQDVQNTVCTSCGETYNKNAPACPRCNTPNLSKMGARFVTFDFLGGVPADYDLGDGVTADEAKRFVASNTQRYIPKFAVFKSGKKASWNWASFLAPSAWFFSRKMYVFGVIAATLEIAFTMLMLPFNNAINTVLPVTDTTGYMEMSNMIIEYLPEIGITVFITAFIGLLLIIALKILCGIFGDKIYNRYVLSTVIDIKENYEDKDTAFRKKGGMSIWLALLGLMIVEYLPMIVSMFF